MTHPSTSPTTTTTRIQRQQAIQLKMLENRNLLGKPESQPMPPNLLTED
ncbi:MAG TPA: hypothetical protein IGR64_04440 [Leptolyngbyaceae cyanobacterium M65_K2018_010]|nr:hypothetical protein [Leptolyngbyaceae cyanobacterium M65_K2018_010]